VIVKCIYRGADGSTTCERVDFSDPEAVRRYRDSRPKVPYQEPMKLKDIPGRTHRSLSCGVPLHQLADAKKVDQQLGVSDEYETRGQIAFKAFNGKQKWRDKANWLRAHRMVDHQAGPHNAPVPGDFVGR
jgi:hypothetical protein